MIQSCRKMKKNLNRAGRCLKFSFAGATSDNVFFQLQADQDPEMAVELGTYTVQVQQYL